MKCADESECRSGWLGGRRFSACVCYALSSVFALTHFTLSSRMQEAPGGQVKLKIRPAAAAESFGRQLDITKQSTREAQIFLTHSRI
jgi:hypothetical protein